MTTLAGVQVPMPGDGHNSTALGDCEDHVGRGTECVGSLEPMSALAGPKRSRVASPIGAGIQ